MNDDKKLQESPSYSTEKRKPNGPGDMYPDPFAPWATPAL